MEAVLNFLPYIGWVLLAITILVFIHELGHYLAAKLFKMRVERFSVGFPPKILSKQIGETEYVLGATPLGGYVKISGMVDESMDTDTLHSEPEPWEFRAKPVWQRIIVITAGVAFNIFLAIFIFIALKYAYGNTTELATEDGSVYVAEESLAYNMGLRTGDRVLAISGTPFDPYNGARSLDGLLADSLTITVERDGKQETFEGPQDIMTQLQRAGGSLGLSFQPSIIGAVMDESPAQEAGLQEGDRIVSIGGEPVPFWVQMSEAIQSSEGQPLRVVWVRPDSVSPTPVAEAATDSIASTVPVRYADGGRVMQGQITPRQDPGSDKYVFGILAATRHEDFTLGESIVGGFEDTWLNTRATAVSLKRVFTGRENFRENIGGPVMVAVVAKQAADAGPRQFWFIVALLSITLAIVNILPIPALDGGHLVFLLYEGITRREPSLRVRMVMQQIGMVLLLCLMAFLIFNDILRL